MLYFAANLRVPKDEKTSQPVNSDPGLKGLKPCPPIDEKTYPQAYKDLMAVPLPTLLTSHEDQTKLTTENTMVCLQRELLRNHFGSNIRYLGTKDLRSCIFLCLYQANDTVVVHWDHIPYLGLTEDIKKFPGKEINVTLVGGKVNFPLTTKIIKDILSVLQQAALETGKTIIIRNQMLVEANKFTDADKRSYIFSFVGQQAKLIHRQLYREELPGETPLSPVFFETKKEKFNPAYATYMSALLVRAQRFYSKKQFKNIQAFIQLINAEVAGHKKTGKTLEDKTPAIFPADLTIVHPQHFYSLLEMMYCAQGFEILRGIIENTDMYPAEKLINVAFDCITHKLIILPPDIPTPYEELRDAIGMDFCTGNYSCFYDSQRKSPMQLPALQPAFIKTTSNYTHIIPRQNLVFEETVFTRLKKDFGFSHKSHWITLDTLCTYIAWAASNQKEFAMLAQGGQLDAESAICSSRNWYSDDEVKATNTSQALKDFTDQPFRLKLRKGNDPIVDALLPFNSPSPLIQKSVTREMQYQLTEKLASKFITFEIIKFFDFGECLCVTDIHNAENARKILATVPESKSDSSDADNTTSPPWLRCAVQ